MIAAASPIADLQRCDGAPDLFNNADTLVAEGHAIGDIEDIRVAEAAVGDP
jgi:hypothetical protein